MKFSVFKAGLQRRLVSTFLALALFPMLVMGILSYNKSSKALVEQTNNQMRNLTKSAILDLESAMVINLMHMGFFLQTFKIATDYVQFGMEIDVGNKQILSDTFSESKKKYPYLQRIRLFDFTGKESYSSDTANSEKAEVISKSPWFMDAQKTKEIFFCDMFLSGKDQQPTVIMAKTIFSDDGKPAAMLAVDISGKYFTRSVDTTKIGKDGYGYILNKDGFVIAYPDKEKLFNLNLSSYDFGREMLQKKQGLMEYVWEGKKKFAAFQQFPAMDWIVVFSATTDDILGAVFQMRNLFIVLGLAISAVAIAIALFVSLRITKPLIRAIEGLTDASEQVTDASGQISSSSQSQAEGASEQAASLEQTSSSLEEMSSMTRQNAGHANEADNLMKEANKIVSSANDSMQNLTTSMQDISQASKETSKIIKTIDEIAFQTNLLALNAAVEAARAGEAGAGFAVVADEVRNLAMRAADAAKNTAQLIEGTVKKVNDGTGFVTKAAEAFAEVAKNALKVGELISEIAAASNEQAQGIEQVNKAVTEMDKVTQQNAAFAEEAASASEELSAQAMEMKAIVQELMALVGGQANRNGQEPEAEEMPVRTTRIVQPAHGRKEPVRRIAPLKEKEVGPDRLLPLDDDANFRDF